ncbi:MAG: hypothetical protein ACOY4K_00615 [Pseudomonadota bacterium]
MTEYLTYLPLALSILAAVVWLVRLEGRVNALNTLTEAQATALKAAMDGHSATTIEVVRLQEQIKHLTDLIERYFVPAAPRGRRQAGEG